MSGEGARWRSETPPPRPHSTALLFHVADDHGQLGVLPNFGAGETWPKLHDKLHAAGDCGHVHED